MIEVSLKTHLIITDIHDEFEINWFGKLKDADPVWQNDMPVFIVQAEGTYMEINTWDMKHIEKICKKITNPRGRGSVSKDQARIYLKEKGNKRRKMGVVTHRRIKSFAPMYDKVEWRDG